MKRIWYLLIFTVFLFGLHVLPAESSVTTAGNNLFSQNFLNNEDTKLKKEIKDSIIKIYGKNDADEIYNNVIIHA